MGLFEAKRMIVDYYPKLSGDPLLVQFVRGPTVVNPVGIYSSELFQEPRIKSEISGGG